MFLKHFLFLTIVDKKYEIQVGVCEREGGEREKERVSTDSVLLNSYLLHRKKKPEYILSSIEQVSFSSLLST